ncbi:hypothetical protein V2703_00500 [Tenacibaculum maritimum]
MVTAPLLAFIVSVCCVFLKIAIIFLSAFTVTFSGLIFPVTSPAHSENSYPVLGIASNVTTVPLS